MRNHLAASVSRSTPAPVWKQSPSQTCASVFPCLAALRNQLTASTQSSSTLETNIKTALRRRVSLFGRRSVPHQCFRAVFFNSVSVIKTITERVLRFRKSLRGGRLKRNRRTVAAKSAVLVLFPQLLPCTSVATFRGPAQFLPRNTFQIPSRGNAAAVHVDDVDERCKAFRLCGELTREL
jgi:hypothetical protein